MRSWAIKSKIFLFILIVFYLCFTAYKLDVRVVPDEAWLSAPAYTFLTQGKMSIPAFKGDPDGRDRICLGSPLRVLLLAVAFKVFGFGVIQGRLLSLVFGLLTIVFTYYLAKYMFDQRIALFSSALVATDNYIFLTSRTIRPEIYLAAFLLVSFVVFVKALDKKSGVLFFISGLMLGLAVFMHINGVIAFAAFSLIYVSEYGLSGLRKRSYWHFAAGFAIILLSFIVYLLLLTYPDKINYLLGQYLIKSQMHESRLFPLFSSNWLIYSLQGEVFKRYADFISFPFRLHIFMVSVFAIVYAWFSRNRANRMLLIMILTYIIAFWLIIANKNVRYLVIILPYLLILIASSAFNFFKKFFGKFKFAPILLLSLLIVTQIGGNALFLYKFRDSGYNSFISRLKEIIPARSAIYGPITYWLGLKEYSYYAFEGVSFKRARDDLNAKIYILGSRELNEIDSYGVAYHSSVELKRGMEAYFRQHGECIGEVENSFYGDLKIYSLE